MSDGFDVDDNDECLWGDRAGASMFLVKEPRVELPQVSLLS